MENKILRLMLSLIVIIALTHIVSLSFYLYFDFWWLDIVMHFWGGFWVVLFFFWLFFFVFKIENKSFLSILLIAIFFNLSVSICWEIFEFKLGIALASKNYWPDTITDTLSSLSGALLSALYFNNGLRKQKNGQQK